MGLRYAAASGWVGAAKSTVCRWLKREPLNQPTLAGRVLEMDGLWTRAASLELRRRYLALPGWESSLMIAGGSGIRARMLSHRGMASVAAPAR